MSIRKIIGTVVLAGVAFGAKTALRAEQASYYEDDTAQSEQSESKKSFNVPSLGFLSRNKTVKSLNLTSFDRPIFNGCVTDHEIQQVKEYSHFSAKDLCACTAKHATAKIPSEHLSEYMRIHAVFLNYSSISAHAQSSQQKDELKENWNIVIGKMMANSELSAEDFSNTLTIASEINQVCRSPNVYTPVSLAKIAQMQLLHIQSQNISVKLRPAQNEQQALNNK